MPTPLEHDYIGFTEPSSPPPMEVSTSDKISPSLSSSSSSSSSANHGDEKNDRETELRLGLPGSQSPERKPSSGLVSHEGGMKRGFSDAIDADSCGKSWALSVGNGSEASLKVNNGVNANCGSSPTVKETGPKAVQEKPSEHSSPPAFKAQVVGWPPIRSFRKNTMASNLSKNNEESEEKAAIGCLYVKVSMDGAPYLRKVDLKTCQNYSDLSSALEKMFSCFTIGQCGSAKLPERNGSTERCLKDLLRGSEYVVTYEDKDGDWMLVGDVPWDMFTDTCRRLRIMKGSEAIGLAPRAVVKCKSRN